MNSPKLPLEHTHKSVESYRRRSYGNTAQTRQRWPYARIRCTFDFTIACRMCTLGCRVPASESPLAGHGQKMAVCTLSAADLGARFRALFSKVSSALSAHRKRYELGVC